MNKLTLILFLALVSTLRVGATVRAPVQLYCHRTANRDLPENTLESLALAARMGCNLVEVDVRMTIDGEVVLNHDGYLERLTEGMGDVELTSYDELQLLDFGGWMAPRFRPERIPRLVDALRLAREQGITLHLDIKQKGEGAAIYAILQREGMIDKVVFANDEGNAEDLRTLMPASTRPRDAWFGPTVTAAEIVTAHGEGKFVIANFSENPHQMDLPAMRAAVAAGVDAINVDYPRLGAEAVGQPVEAKLASLAIAASVGTVANRTDAIRELSRYPDFPTREFFQHLLRDPDAQVSRAAAVALVLARPSTPAEVFLDALKSTQSSTRQNGAWALGMTHAAVTEALIPLLKSQDPAELKEVLLALSLCPGDVPAEQLLPFLDHKVPTVRAAAALALSRHQPDIAAVAIPELLHREEEHSAAMYAAYVQRGMPKLTQVEIDPLIEDFRLHMKLIHALELLPARASLPLLARESFRHVDDFSHVTSVLAGYGLWDRIAADPELAIAGLDSSNIEVADRAEWMLVKAGAAVLPAVRHSMIGAAPEVRRRLIYILAWQGDALALPLLHQMRQSSPQDEVLLAWAIHTIQMLGFQQ